MQTLDPAANFNLYRMCISTSPVPRTVIIEFQNSLSTSALVRLRARIYLVEMLTGQGFLSVAPCVVLHIFSVSLAILLLNP